MRRSLPQAPKWRRRTALSSGRAPHMSWSHSAARLCSTGGEEGRAGQTLASVTMSASRMAGEWSVLRSTHTTSLGPRRAWRPDMARAEQLGTLPGHGRVFRRRFCREQPQHWNSDTHRPQKAFLWYRLPIGLATSCIHPRRDPDSAADSGKRKWGPVTHPCHYFRLPGPVPRKEPGPLVGGGGGSKAAASP